MKTRTINIRVGGVLVLLLLGLVGYLLILMYDVKRDRDALQLGMFDQAKTMVRYKIEIDSLKEQVVEANLTVLHSDKALKESKEYGERLRKLNIRRVNAIGKLEMRIAVLEDSLQLHRGQDTVYVRELITEEDTIPVVEVPFQFGINDRWVAANAFVDELGYGEIDFMVKEMPVEIVLGSRGMFRPSCVSAVSSPNPYLNIERQSFVIVKDNKKKPAAYLATGLLIGTMVTLLLH